MKRVVPLTTAILAVTLAGSAATPRAYNPEESRALNLVTSFDTPLRHHDDTGQSIGETKPDGMDFCICCYFRISGLLEIRASLSSMWSMIWR